MFVIREAFTGVTTQGRTMEEAMENLKEAVELYLEEMPEVATEIKKHVCVISSVPGLNAKPSTDILLPLSPPMSS